MIVHEYEYLEARALKSNKKYHREYQSQWHPPCLYKIWLIPNIDNLNYEKSLFWARPITLLCEGSNPPYWGINNSKNLSVIWPSEYSKQVDHDAAHHDEVDHDVAHHDVVDQRGLVNQDGTGGVGTLIFTRRIKLGKNTRKFVVQI